MFKKYFYILIVLIFSNINCGNFKIFGPDGFQAQLSEIQKKLDFISQVIKDSKISKISKKPENKGRPSGALSGEDIEKLINSLKIEEYIKDYENFINKFNRIPEISNSTPLRNFLKKKNFYIGDISDSKNSLKNFQNALKIQKANYIKIIIPSYKKTINHNLMTIAEELGESTFRKDMLRPNHRENINEAVKSLNELFDNDMALSDPEIVLILENLYKSLIDYLALFRNMEYVRRGGEILLLKNPEKSLEEHNKSIKENLEKLNQQMENLKKYIAKEIREATPIGAPGLAEIVAEYASPEDKKTD